MRCAVHPQDEAIGVCVLCGAAVCAQCQQLVGRRTLCAACYAELTPGGQSERTLPSAPPVQEPRKSPFWAFTLGLIPGLGHLYLGQLQKGMVLIGAAWALYYVSDGHPPGVFLLPLLVIYSAFDGVHTAHGINTGRPTADWPVGELLRREIHIKPIRVGCSWTLVFGVVLVIVGLLNLWVGSWQWRIYWSPRVYHWLWQVPPGYRLLANNIMAVILVVVGAYLLWRSMRPSPTAPS